MRPRFPVSVSFISSRRLFTPSSRSVTRANRRFVFEKPLSTLLLRLRSFVPILSRRSSRPASLVLTSSKFSILATDVGPATAHSPS